MLILNALVDINTGCSLSVGRELNLLEKPTGSQPLTIPIGVSHLTPEYTSIYLEN